MTRTIRAPLSIVRETSVRSVRGVGFQPASCLLAGWKPTPLTSRTLPNVRRASQRIHVLLRSSPDSISYSLNQRWNRRRTVLPVRLPQRFSCSAISVYLMASIFLVDENETDRNALHSRTKVRHKACKRVRRRTDERARVSRKKWR
jgi:hypothetical protein